MLRIEIRKCLSDSEVMSTFEVMSQLRDIPKENYVSLIRAMQESEKCQLIGAYIPDNRCVAAAVFRVKRSLFRKGERELQVDDFVTDESFRSQGVGHELITGLKTECERENCVGITLDSGLQRVDAHRFYEKEGFQSTAFHFYLEI